MVRGWIVADVLSLVLLPTTALASAFSDRLPSNVVVGQSAGPRLMRGENEPAVPSPEPQTATYGRTVWSDD